MHFRDRKIYFLYRMSNLSKTRPAGVTNNLIRRVREHCRLVLLSSLLVFSFVNKGVGLQDGLPSAEQSEFSMETDFAPIQHPKDVPDGVVRLLRTDRILANCAGNGSISPDQVPASWFVASEVHLGGPDEIDLVVQGRDLHIALPPNLCVMGVNIKPFWVFRKTEQGYSMVLSTAAHDLNILRTRSKGFRDIQVFSMTAVKGSSSTYKFDGAKYQVSKTDSKPLR